jgi:hypothetical protein
MKSQSFSMEINPGDIVTFVYRNYAGKISKRTAKVLRFYWAANEYHPEPQFLMAALDLDKQEPRGFAVKDISELELVGNSKVLETPAEDDIEISYIDKGSNMVLCTRFPRSAKKYAIAFQRKKLNEGAVIVNGTDYAR